MAISLAGLAVLALARKRESTRLAVAGGALLALAVAVKLLAVVALSRRRPCVGRRPRPLPPTAGRRRGSVAAHAVRHRVVDELWADVVGFHNDAREGSLADNAETVLRSLHPRRAWAFLVVASALLAVLPSVHARRAVLAWLWAAAAFAFLAWHRPLLDHHFALLAAAASVAAGATLVRSRPPPRRDRRSRRGSCGADSPRRGRSAVARGERVAAPQDDVARADKPRRCLDRTPGGNRHGTSRSSRTSPTASSRASSSTLLRSASRPVRSTPRTCSKRPTLPAPALVVDRPHVPGRSRT